MRNEKKRVNKNAAYKIKHGFLFWLDKKSIPLNSLLFKTKVRDFARASSK